MPNISKIQLPNGTTYDLRDDSKSEVSIDRKTTSGTNIADITIDGTTTQLYAPSSGSGGSKNIWYGYSTTAANTATKIVTTTSGDFTLTNGNMVRVLFTNANTYNGVASLVVDGTSAVSVARVKPLSATTTTRYYWTAGEVVDLVYDGANFVMSAKGTATTSYYGLTKLSSSTSSTSNSLAATPSAVKSAYDHATLAYNLATEANTAMTDQEVESAVQGVWEAVYSLTYETGNPNYVSVTNDGTYGETAGIITEASEGETITVYTASTVWVPAITRADTSATVSWTTVASGLYSFTMPNSAVYVGLYFDD